MVIMLDEYHFRLVVLTSFIPALAYELPPQVTKRYAVNPTSGRMVLHHHEKQVVKVLNSWFGLNYRGSVIPC
jgi:hypothetical protein